MIYIDFEISEIEKNLIFADRPFLTNFVEFNFADQWQKRQKYILPLRYLLFKMVISAICILTKHV